MTKNVLHNCRHADDNLQTVLTMSTKQDLDWPTFSMIARVILSFNAENATVQ